MKTALSEADAADIKDVISLFDSSNEGFITCKEAYIGFRALDIPCTANEIKDLALHCSQTHGYSDMIRSNDFFQLAAHKLANKPQDERYRRSFSLFDIQSKGFITLDDLKRKVSELGSGIEDKELQLLIFIEMIDEADSNGDGKVTEADFMRMLAKTEHLTGAWNVSKSQNGPSWAV